MISTDQHWDAIYDRALINDSDPLNCTEVLRENAFLLPPKGKAFDLACGMGANAMFLARHGLAVTAVDISKVAIDKLSAYASCNALDINAYDQNIDPNSIHKCAFDVIVVSRFLDRRLSDAIIDALKPDGLLFYQTFTREKVSPRPPNNPDYLLMESELLALFAPLKVLFYRDNALIGNRLRGLRNEAQFVGQKCRV